MKKILLTILMVGMFQFLSIVALNAYCIQNTTDTQIIVHQGNGIIELKNSLKIELRPGENFCCKWKDSKCNKSMEPDALVRFNVDSTTTRICRGVEVRADGVLVVSGKNGKYQCLPLVPIRPIPAPNDRIE